MIPTPLTSSRRRSVARLAHTARLAGVVVGLALALAPLYPPGPSINVSGFPPGPYNHAPAGAPGPLAPLFPPGPSGPRG